MGNCGLTATEDPNERENASLESERVDVRAIGEVTKRFDHAAKYTGFMPALHLVIPFLNHRPSRRRPG